MDGGVGQKREQDDGEGRGAQGGEEIDGVIIEPGAALDGCAQQTVEEQSKNTRWSQAHM